MTFSSVKPIFFFKTPDLTEYCLEVAGFTRIHERNFIHMVSSCRKIIELEPNVLACPSGDGYWTNCVQVIVHKEYKNARSFKSNLKKNQLEFLGGGGPVDYASYQRALKNTILMKLCPKWCTVENYLIEGEDFLSKSGPIEAISSLEIVVNKDKTHITFEGIMLNWPQIAKMPFGLYSQQDITMYTLPTMKASHVHSVTPVLPQWGPVATYEDMKIFWKNTYGYKLPENPGCDLAYVTVNFGHSPSQYNYPKYCCLPCVPTAIVHVDPFAIIGKFLRDFYNRIGSILGQRLQFLDNKAAFATNQIYSLASLTKDSKNFDNISLTHTVSAPGYPLKDMANNKRELSSSSTMRTQLSELPDITLSEQDVHKSVERYIPVFNARKIKPQMIKKENHKVAITGPLAPESLERICNVEIKNDERTSAATSVNIEHYAENNMLYKANITQLKDYLKCQNIPFKSTDKKNVLIQAAENFLQIETA